MIEETLNSDVAKELLAVLAYCDNSLIKNVPNSLLGFISEIAADSTKNFYIDKTKSLLEQNLSNECRDLLGVIYYFYMSELPAKEKLLNSWLQNENDTDNSEI